MQDKLGIIEPGELDTIAAARRTLQTWENRADAAYLNTKSLPDAFNAGLIREAASQADGRVFDVLNALNSFADADIPAAVIHARAPSEPQTPRREVRAVVDVESDPPEVIGTFLAEDDGLTAYLDSNSVRRSAQTASVAIVSIAV